MVLAVQSNSTNPWVLIWDNAPHTVRSIRNALHRAAYEVSVHSTITAFTQKLEDLRRLGERVAFVVLDMHDENVRDLSKLNKPGITTQNGASVGLALARHILWDQALGFGNIPVLIYSARRMPDDAGRIIRECQSTGRPIEAADKDDKIESVLSKTRKFSGIDYAIEAELNDAEIAHSLNLHRDHALRWGFSKDEIICMFGYRSQRNVSLDSLIRSIAANPSKDIETRIHLLIDIRIGLDTFFGVDDLEAQQSWLNTTERKFGERTPKNLLVSGSIEDVFAVAYYIRDRVR